MARDKRSEKVAHTFYPFGYYSKFRDAGYDNRDRKTMQEQPEPGRADAILVPIPPAPCHFIEAKNGDGVHKERFPFAKWNERQRLFALGCAWSGIPYWIFLMMGTHIDARQYPLIALMITAEQMLEVEQMAGTRKSLSYATAAQLFTPLPWVTGEDRWEIPESHPFIQSLRGHHDYHASRAPRANRQNQRSATAQQVTPQKDSLMEIRPPKHHLPAASASRHQR